jgi:membrane protease YdiL (CAAX protease family)
MSKLHDERFRLPISLVVLVAWAGIMALAAHFTAGSQTSVVQFVSHGVAWPIVIAAGFLFLVLKLMGWRDVGFRSFELLAALKLMWLPAIYVLAFGAVALVLGLPPAENLAFILINTCFVGLSEELMFRGILFSGLRSRLELRPSIWICCILFGLIHVLNAVQTGQLTVAALQAAAAFMTGTMFLAIRLRTGSLYPVIILHAVWDCMPLLIATHLGDANPDQPLPAQIYFAPLFVLPNFLYALYLIRSRKLRDFDGRQVFQVADTG